MALPKSIGLDVLTIQVKQAEQVVRQIEQRMRDHFCDAGAGDAYTLGQIIAYLTVAGDAVGQASAFIASINELQQRRAALTAADRHEAAEASGRA